MYESRSKLIYKEQSWRNVDNRSHISIVQIYCNMYMLFVGWQKTNVLHKLIVIVNKFKAMIMGFSLWILKSPCQNFLYIVKQ